MIWVKYQTRNKVIESIDVSGHADFAQQGQDIVCAACSLTVTGLCNAIDQLTQDSCEIQIEEGHTHIAVLNDSEQLQLILQTGIIQLKTLAERFRRYVRVRKVEVK